MPRSVRADRADFGEGEIRDADIFLTVSENLRPILRGFGRAPESLFEILSVPRRRAVDAPTVW